MKVVIQFYYRIQCYDFDYVENISAYFELDEVLGVKRVTAKKLNEKRCQIISLNVPVLYPILQKLNS